MSFQDFFKSSVWESFASRQELTASVVTNIVVSLIVALLIGLFIYWVYRKYFGGVVFSRSFATTQVGMTVLTCMVTLAISTDVVIALGMVGALSIIRYRTAIKDPMDLLYLFWAVTVGITAGASLYFLAIVASLVMVVLIHVLYYRQKAGNIFLMVVHYTGERTGDEVLRSLASTKHQLKSTTLRGDVTEMIVEVFNKGDNTLFAEKAKQLEGVQDVTLVQYNGEYHA